MGRSYTRQQKDANNARRKALRDAGLVDRQGRRLDPGQRLKGISTLRGPNGELRAEWEKTERESHDPPAFAVVGDGFAVQRVTSMLDGQGQVRLQHVSTERGPEERFTAFRKAVETLGDTVKPLASVRAPRIELSADLLEVYPLGDPHIGMLAWGDESGADFDLTIAREELETAIDLLVERARPAKEALLLNLGDFWHAQSNEQRTPRGGHKLDVDSRLPKICEIGLAIMVRLILRLLEKHELVTVWNVCGNHDPELGLMLYFVLSAWFRDNPRVTIERNFAPFWYKRHGKQLIAATHGHLCTPQDLETIMLADRPRDCGETEFRDWLTGHVHHEQVIELRTCRVEKFGTLAAKDSYAVTRWRARRYLDALSYHAVYGLIDRRRVDRKLARARLDGAF